VEYLAVDEIKANIQAKLQALGRHDWEGAHAILFEHFARQSTRVGGATVTRASVIELLGLQAQPPLSSYPPTLAARPTVPTRGEPQALIAAALEARRLLLVCADVPLPPEERPSAPQALLINRWQQDAQSLPPFSWPLHELPPASILSLDPSDRIEVDFREADVPLNLLRTRQDVIDPSQHNLIKLGGDLSSRHGLLLTEAHVRDVPNHPDKVHLLKEAQNAARDGVVVMLADDPGRPFRQLWRQVVHAYLSSAKHCFALGPAEARWPSGVEHLSADVNGVFAQLAGVEVSPSTPSALEAHPSAGR
jgi:hypothetical protein